MKKKVLILTGLIMLSAIVLTACVRDDGKARVPYKNEQISIEKVVLEDGEIDETVQDVNFYATLGTLPTLYAGLDLFSKDEISFMWFERTGTLDISKLPTKTEMITETGTYTKEIMNAIINKVNYASKKYPNAKLHLYCDDMRVQFSPLCFELMGIADTRYDVTLLSDGTATYANFKSLLASDNTFKNWTREKSSIDSFVSDCAQQNASGIDIANNSQYQLSMFAFAQRENAKFWMQYPEFLVAKDPKVAAEMEKINFEKKLPEQMYIALTVEQQVAFSNAVGLDKAKFDELYFNKDNEKPYMIITGTNPIDGRLGNDQFKNVIEQLIQKYGEEYNLLFKPHPSAMPNAENGYEDYFASKNISVLPGRLPMEVLVWAYPDVKLGGFNSTLYLSAPKGNTLFFIAKDKTSLSQPLQNLFDELYSDAEFFQPIVSEAEFFQTVV